jgi:PadR family transcriptional regulator PadR
MSAIMSRDDGIRWPRGTELRVLQLLVARGELYGLALVKASDGGLKRGTVYVTLSRMEEKGFVSSRDEVSTPDYVGITRRLYKVTGLGESMLRAVEIGEAMIARNLVPA